MGGVARACARMRVRVGARARGLPIFCYPPIPTYLIPTLYLYLSLSTLVLFEVFKLRA